MAAKSLRLLHAANLRLDCPLKGTGLLDDEVRETVEVATLRAFDRIVATSIEKDVDALLITGNTFDASFASLAAEVSLRDGFGRLAERHIPVFIVPGEIDPATAWLELPKLPDNVTLFTDVEEACVDLTDHGHHLATLLPVTANSSVEPHELENILGGRTNAKGARPFVVGLLLPDQTRSRTEKKPSIETRFSALDWLVCPAGTDTSCLPLTDGLVHVQSSPQGLEPSETGVHGVTLLEVDSNRKTRRTSMPMATVRFEKLTQKTDRVRGRDDLLERMLGQLEQLANFKGELVRIIQWQLDCTTGDGNGWESDATAKELADSLTELSDRPDGLRYVHRVMPLEPDLTLVEPAHREVFTEYLMALRRRAPASIGTLEKWLTDARVGDVVKPGHWEHWMESITPEQVTERAQQLGWKWFSTIVKK